jgi:hypothetical protein
MAKSKRPSAQASPGPRSGRGAGSALQEMLRRQAQNPRPGTSAQPPGDGRHQPAPKAHHNVPHNGNGRNH